MTPSKFQTDIFDFVASGQGHGVVRARAGSGKTTTIVEALKHVPSGASVLMLAFNKSIATELETRVPRSVQVRTLNALGHRAWMQHVGRVELNKDKTWEIMRSTWEENDLWRFGPSVSRLVGFAKTIGIAPKTDLTLKGLVADSLDEWMSMIEHFDVDIGYKGKEGKDNKVGYKKWAEVMIEKAREILAKSAATHTLIDFADQLYLTLIHRAKLPKYDFVFVDEAQDLSAIQRELVMRCMKPTTRSVWVGDDFQSIYGFAGSAIDSINVIQKMLGAKQLPLSISYRCPKAHVRLAQPLVPDIESHPSAIEGAILESEPISAVRPGDMVICRTTKPLVKLSFAYRAAGRKAVIRGRDRGMALVAMIDRLVGEDNLRTCAEFKPRLDKWLEDEIKRLLERDPDANTEFANEKHASVDAFLQCMPSGATISALKDDIKGTFVDVVPPGAISLCTIHKSKGLEADKVYILNRELTPSKYAKKGWELQQETHLAYISYTRAKQTLSFIEHDNERPKAAFVPKTILRRAGEAHL